MTRGQGKAPSQRQLRVGEEIRHALARVLERGEIHDPSLSNRIVTITEVRLSPDLRNATAFVTPLGGGDVDAVLAGLKRVRSYLRHAIGQSVRLRCVPELRFEADASFDEAARIDALLRSRPVRRDVEAAASKRGEDDFDDEGRPGDDQEGRDDGA